MGPDFRIINILKSVYMINIPYEVSERHFIVFLFQGNKKKSVLRFIWLFDY